MQQILFIELLGGLGDVLIALPAIQALARSHPTAQLTVLTFAPGGELLESDPLIHHVVYAEKGNARSSVEQLLHDRSFDLVVCDVSYDRIDQLLQTSTAKRVVTNLWRSPPVNQFVSDRFIEILQSEALITEDAIAPATLHLRAEELADARSKLDSSKSIAVLCVDAGMKIKRWSSEKFIEVGRDLQNRYGASIVVPVGGDLDSAIAVVQALGDDAQLWQPGSLRSLAAMLSHTQLMVAADTGPARIAAAVGVPTITLFGPSWHQRYGQPLPHVNLQGVPNCPERNIHNFTEQTCWYSGECPFEWESCVTEISVQSVLNAIDRIWQCNGRGCCY